MRSARSSWVRRDAGGRRDAGARTARRLRRHGAARPHAFRRRRVRSVRTDPGHSGRADSHDDRALRAALLGAEARPGQGRWFPARAAATAQLPSPSTSEGHVDDSVAGLEVDGDAKPERATVFQRAAGVDDEEALVGMKRFRVKARVPIRGSRASSSATVSTPSLSARTISSVGTNQMGTASRPRARAWRGPTGSDRGASSQHRKGVDRHRTARGRTRGVEELHQVEVPGNALHRPIEDHHRPFPCPRDISRVERQRQRVVALALRGCRSRNQTSPIAAAPATATNHGRIYIVASSRLCRASLDHAAARVRRPRGRSPSATRR